MTKLELINKIVDRIVDIDRLVTRVPAGTDRDELMRKRDRLSACRRELSRAAFDENTAGYQAAAADLDAVNTQLKATIGDVNQIVSTMATIVMFIGAVEKIFNTVGLILP